MSKKKKKKYSVSPALMYTGLMPVLRKPMDISGHTVYITLWFDNVIVRNEFLALAATVGDGAEYIPDTVPLSKLSTKEYEMDLYMGKVVYKISKKKKVRTIPLDLLYEFYQQHGEKVVDK